MLAAAEQRANAELDNGRLDGSTKLRQPMRATSAGHDVRFFRDLAERPEIGQRIRGGGSPDSDCQTDPGSCGERRKRWGSVQLLKQAQKPVRRRPGSGPLILRAEDIRRHREHRLKEIYAHEETEGRQLQER